MESKPDPLIDLFVVHWKQPLQCIATVKGLLMQGIPLRTIVIDNGSDPSSFELLKSELDKSVTVVRLTENRGWGGALNILLSQWLREALGDYCFISAHDTALEPDCLPRMMAAMKGDRQIGIACPQYHDPVVARLSMLHGVRPEKVPEQPIGFVQEVDVPHGTLMLLRRTCLEHVGLFDERYFAYGDEHELGARAARRGWKVVMVWGAIAINPGTWTSSRTRSYLFARNSLLLVRDYFGRPAAWLRATLLLGNTLRLMLVRTHDSFAYSARARWHAVCDYFAGRFGRPTLR